jgi:hypothetical protein
MRFEDFFVSIEHRFSIGKEADSGKYYLSIPVSNGIVDYEEYYEITEKQAENLASNLEAEITFAEECRKRQKDDLLIVKPGASRGVAD